MHKAFKTWEIPSVFPSFLILHQEAVSETKKVKLGEREGDRQLSPSLHVTASPQHSKGRFGQCGTAPGHTILVFLVPDMGLFQPLTLFMAREHPAKEILCCVKPTVQKPFQAWACSNEGIKSLAYLISLSRGIRHLRSGKVA